MPFLKLYLYKRAFWEFWTAIRKTAVVKVFRKFVFKKLQAAIYVHYNNFLEISQIKTFFRMPLGKYPMKTLLWDISRWSVHVFYISIRQIQFGLSYAYSISNFSVLIYICNIRNLFNNIILCYSWRKILALEIDGTLSLYVIILFFFTFFVIIWKFHALQYFFVNSR